MQVQVRLIDLGYMIGPPDGLWGNKSRQALRAFKAANGIQTDDKWDSEISAKFDAGGSVADKGGRKGRAVTAESELAERTHGSMIPNPGRVRSRNDMPV
jgi:peptidoglycan hydrolase-like protein with peptidoglycan-binding domain